MPLAGYDLSSMEGQNVKKTFLKKKQFQSKFFFERGTMKVN